MELENVKEVYQKAGIGLCAISRDSREVLSKFAGEKSITFPLLADEDFEVIRAFGIINHKVPTDNRNYGIAIPVQYIVDPQGVVQKKVFTENYRERVTQESVLIRHFGWSPETPVGSVETDELVLEYRASQAKVRAGNHITLILDVHPKDKMHVYAPGGEDYIPVSWELKPSPYFKGRKPEFPQAKIMELKALEEKLPVYTGSFRVLQEVVIGDGKALFKSTAETPPLSGELVIEGVFGYQACDDVKCYLPQKVALKFMLGIERHDWDRIVPRPPAAPVKSGDSRN